MNLKHSLAVGLAAGCLTLNPGYADERRFTYIYEPETLPAGAMEYENWVTLRTQRSRDVGLENFNRWDLRQEIEYGVTDRYTIGVYLNEKAESFRDPATDADESEFEFKGLSLENRYNVLNPAEHAIGLTLYLEGTYAGSDAAIEQKIILGQRYGAWKWALNFEHETEWEHNLDETLGEFGLSVGVARDLTTHWTLGLELRSSNKAPEYERVSSSALFLGPVVSYRQEKWWAALSVSPQIYGWNFGGDPDGHGNLDLASHERLNLRLLFGIHF